jgi:hypothetical protein
MEMRRSASVADAVRLMPTEGTMRVAVFPVRLLTWYDFPEEELVQLIVSLGISSNGLGDPSLLARDAVGSEAETFFGPDMVHLPSISLASNLAAFTRLQLSRSINRALCFEDDSAFRVELGVLDLDPVSLIENTGLV